MAKDKATFLMRTNYMHIANGLTDEALGVVFRWVLEYTNDLNPDIPEGVAERLFVNMIKAELKNDLAKYNEKVSEFASAKSLSGKKGNLKKWHPAIYKRFESGEMSLEQALELAETAKLSKKKEQVKEVSQSIANVAKDRKRRKASQTSQTSQTSLVMLCNDNSNNKEKIYKKKKTNYSSDDSGIYREFDHLKISNSQFSKLAEKYGADNVNSKIDYLENMATNKKYKTIHLTVGAWLKKDEAQKKSNEAEFKFTGVKPVYQKKTMAQKRAEIIGKWDMDRCPEGMEESVWYEGLLERSKKLARLEN